MTQELSNLDRINSAIRYQTQEIIQAAHKIENMEWVRDEIAPLLPAGVLVSESSYNYWDSFVQLYIPPVENRPWKGLNGTAGLIYRVRKSLSIEKFTRRIEHTYGNSFQSEFRGEAKLTGKTVQVSVILANQAPDNCRVEWEEVEVPAHTEKKMRTVCGPTPVAV